MASNSGKKKEKQPKKNKANLLSVCCVMFCNCEPMLKRMAENGKSTHRIHTHIHDDYHSI